MKGFTENDMILIGKLEDLGLHFKIGVHEVKVSDGDNVKVSFPISEGQNLCDSFMAELKRARKEDDYARTLYFSLKSEINQPIAEVHEKEKVIGFGRINFLQFDNLLDNLGISDLLKETSKIAKSTTEQIKNNRIKNAIQNLQKELDQYTKGN